MVRVSKNLLDDDVFLQIDRLLVKHIEKIGDSRRTSKLFRELLSPTERLQLAKRFAIIVMLAEGESTSNIEQTLKVSRTTIGTLMDKLDRGEFSETLALYERGRHDAAWTAIEKVLRAGMPPRGRHRWKNINT